MIFPERNPLTAAHGFGKQLGLLVGKVLVRADIKKWLDRRIDEHGDRAVHCDHRNVGEFMERKVLCRTARSDHENRA
ncbi:hypothetical protein D3C72_2148900 [compost metagenome]